MVIWRKPLTSTKEHRQLISDNISAVKALDNIEEYVQSSTTTVSKLFHELDANYDGFLEKNEFVTGILKLTDIALTRGQVEALVDLVDYSGDGFVQLDELEKYMKVFRKLKREKGKQYLTTLFTKQDNDNVFPNWLTARSDFCSLFTRFVQDSTGENVDEGKIGKLFVDVRPKLTRENMHRLGRWLQQKNILNGLSFQRYVDLSQKMHFMETTSGQILCQQGEIGDAFFIIFSGSVDIIVDSIKVITLCAGESFGERSLETNGPRNATGQCSCSCQILYIKAHDYKMLVKQHRTKKLKYAINFLQNDCLIMRMWSYSKISTLSTMLVRRTISPGEYLFRQDDDCYELYLILSGTASAQKTAILDNQNNERSRFHLKYLKRGELIGEEFLIGFKKRQYCALAVTAIDCFVINRKDALNYFFGEEDTIKSATKDLYVSIIELAKRRRKRRTLSDIKKHSFGEKYSQRLNNFSKI